VACGVGAKEWVGVLEGGGWGRGLGGAAASGSGTLVHPPYDTVMPYYEMDMDLTSLQHDASQHPGAGSPHALLRAPPLPPLPLAQTQVRPYHMCHAVLR
jgi:hypothetical protein